MTKFFLPTIQRKKILEDALKIWRFDYEEKKSLTNNDSIIVKISNLEKKYEY